MKDDGVLFGRITYGGETTSTAGFCIDKILQVVRDATAMMARYRRERDYGFAKLREEGFLIWAWDRGCGEEWVVEDSACDRVFDGLRKSAVGEFAVDNLGGVAVWRLSAAIANGFSVEGHPTVKDLFDRAIAKMEWKPPLPPEEKP